MKQFNDLMKHGLVPYVATSQNFLPSLDVAALGDNVVVKLMEDSKNHDFHEAYLLSNALSFKSDLKMPHWVYLDCVLMQTAVVGFAMAVKDIPERLLEFYKEDPNVNLDNIDYIPISGQIAAMGLDGQRLTGLSLFSLRQYLPNPDIPALGGVTKYAALAAYKAQEKEKYVGISQYDNKALLTHAAFTDKMYIDTPIAAMHPRKDMSFVYSMKIDLEAYGAKKEVIEPDFLLKADDKDKKIELQERIRAGERFYIAHPTQIKKDDGLYLPICIEE